jgi:hypothetical protein
MLRSNLPSLSTNLFYTVGVYKTTATAMGSSGWHRAATHELRFYGFWWANFLSFRWRQSWMCLCYCNIVLWTNSFRFSAARKETFHSGSSELAGNDVYCGRHTFLRQPYLQFISNLLSLFWKSKRRIIRAPCCLCGPPHLYCSNCLRGAALRSGWLGNSGMPVA